MSRLAEWLRRPAAIAAGEAESAFAEIAVRRPVLQSFRRMTGAENTPSVDLREAVFGRTQREAKRFAPDRDQPEAATSLEPGCAAALYRALSEDALQASARIVKAEMPRAALFLDVAAFHNFCLSKASMKGAHCAFGVFTAQTLNHFASRRPHVVFDGFDSFEGLPETWSGCLQPDFNLNRRLPEVHENVRLHAGLFHETLPAWSQRVDHVSFMHVSCSLYSSAAEVFRSIGHLLREGALIVFGEYFCFPGFEEHERKAFAGFTESAGLRPEWIAVCGQQAACILRR